MKTVKEIARDMAYYSKGNLHDIDHFLRVWGYARDIADGECLSKRERYVLEVAAITHDIACPLCREKYGNTDGKNQEREGAVLVRAFLRDAGIPGELLERIVFLVGHHHSYDAVDGTDYQILLEADYIANALENHTPPSAVRQALKSVFRTKSGIEEAKTMLHLSSLS